MQIYDITEKLEENFARTVYRDDHFERHCNENGEADPATKKQFPGAYAFKLKDIPDAETYERLADAAARKPLQKSVILGYIGIDKRRQKYNKITQEFTSYTVDSAGNPINVTYFPMSEEGWELNKKRGPHRYGETLIPEKDANPE